MTEMPSARPSAPTGRTEPREPIDWEHIARTLAAVVKRAQRADPKEFEPHA